MDTQRTRPAGATRILIVHDRARVRRGSDAGFQEQRRLLRDAGCDVWSFTFDPLGGGDGRDVVYRENRVPVIRKAYRYAFNARVYGRLRRLLAQVRPDLVILNTYWNYPLSVLAACRGWRTIHLVRGNYFVCPTLSLTRACDGRVCEGWFGLRCRRHRCLSWPAWLVLAPMRALWPALSRRWVARHAALSAYLAAVLRRGRLKGVSVLPPFLDTGRRDAAPYPAGSHRVLYAGHLGRGKGLPDLVRAFSEVARRHPSARLVLVGDGPLREWLVAEVRRLGLTHAVEFHGHVTQQEVWRQVDESAVVVIPSDWQEGFSIMGLEAGMLARPVVATRVGGIPDWLEDGEAGFLVEPRDPAALADRINRLLDHPEAAAAMGRRGRVRVVRRFDVAAHRPQLLDLVEKALRPD